MKLLFIGREEDYVLATNGSASLAGRSVFFASSVHNFAPQDLISEFSAAIIPVHAVPKQKLFLLDSLWYIPALASGPDSCMDEAFSFDCCDYLCEPWSETELEARARKCARISFAAGSLYIEDFNLKGPLGLHPLSPEDLLILKLFHANRRKAIPKQALGTLLGLDNDSRALDMRISRLRTLFKKLGCSELAQIQRGVNGNYSIR